MADHRSGEGYVMRKGDHVVISNEQGGHLLRCLHCDDTYLVNLPINLDMFLAMMKVYVRNHRRCKRVSK